MDSPLDRIAFLARSENRMRVLRTVTAEPRTRHELREELVMSRTTLGRVLNEFEERSLIRSTERGYATTVVADAILEKFVPLLETVEGLETLGEAVEWLPPPARELEFRQFRDAEFTTSTAGNPAEPFDRGLELIRAADRYRGLTSTAIPRYVRVIRDGLVEGRVDTEGVVEASVIETVRNNPERAAPWYDFAEAGATGVYDGRVPINMHIVDDRVLIWLGQRHEDGLDVRGLLESTNPAVLSWAESLYDDYWTAAEPLDPAMLPEP
jgi:predicted transcriptional regulator